MIEGQIYKCEECACEIKVIRSSEKIRANPRCGCGAQMKRPYKKPSVQKVTSSIATFATAKTNKDWRAHR
jgi:predicted nucleic acid-binding Zn ribbon protein